MTSVMQVNTGSGVAGMPFRCIALVPGQKIEHAPYLVEYVTLVGLPCKYSKTPESKTKDVIVLSFPHFDGKARNESASACSNVR